MDQTITLEVARYSPERDAAPRFYTFQVPLRREWIVIDALNYIKDSHDGRLPSRGSCGSGIWGSCGMMVNGDRKLTCATSLSDYAPAPLRVEPVRYFPVVRDLVIEMTDVMTKLQKVKPWIIRKEEKPLSEGEYLQTPQQLDSYKQYSMCINCMLCYAACPVYGLDPLFSGPAAIALAQRYNLDSRDQGAKDRFPVLSQHDAIWGCTFVGECTRVCPKHVDPAGAIQQYKLTAALDWVKSVKRGGEFVLLNGAGGIDVFGADARAFADKGAAPDGVVLGEDGEAVFGTLIARVEVVALGERDSGGAGEERVEAIDGAGSVAEHAVDAHAVLLEGFELCGGLQILAFGDGFFFLAD